MKPLNPQRCEFDNTLYYSVFLYNSEGEEIDQREVTSRSDSCSEGYCFVKFDPFASSTDVTYNITVITGSIFGSHTATASICEYNHNYHCIIYYNEYSLGPTRLTAVNQGLLAVAAVSFIATALSHLVTLLYFVWVRKSLRTVMVAGNYEGAYIIIPTCFIPQEDVLVNADF